MYTTNPRIPRLRARAVDMVRRGKKVTEVARYFGYSKSAISKWCQKAPKDGCHIIPTKSSRPHSHPNQISEQKYDQIIAYKRKYKRCPEVIYQHLKNDGIQVGLSTVKRKLDQAGLTKKRSPWKRLHLSVKRPLVLNPGDLVMVDTIHLMIGKYRRIYVYTLIDVYSRWTYAWAVDRINTRQSIKFLNQARKLADFQFKCIQSDNGSEFSQHFTERIKIIHRHSRVRKPNDNSYVERFNRTLQEECLDKIPTDVKMINKIIPKYLKYYNEERLHMGIDFQTPQKMLKRFQAIG